jgi:hypothetical protein
MVEHLRGEVNLLKDIVQPRVSGPARLDYIYDALCLLLQTNGLKEMRLAELHDKLGNTLYRQCHRTFVCDINKLVKQRRLSKRVVMGGAHGSYTMVRVRR